MPSLWHFVMIAGLALLATYIAIDNEILQGDSENGVVTGPRQRRSPEVDNVDSEQIDKIVQATVEKITEGDPVEAYNSFKTLPVSAQQTSLSNVVQQSCANFSCFDQINDFALLFEDRSLQFALVEQIISEIDGKDAENKPKGFELYKKTYIQLQLIESSNHFFNGTIQNETKQFDGISSNFTLLIANTLFRFAVLHRNNATELVNKLVQMSANRVNQGNYDFIEFFQNMEGHTSLYARIVERAYEENARTQINYILDFVDKLDRTDKEIIYKKLTLILRDKKHLLAVVMASVKAGFETNADICGKYNAEDIHDFISQVMMNSNQQKKILDIILFASALQADNLNCWLCRLLSERIKRYELADPIFLVIERNIDFCWSSGFNFDRKKFATAYNAYTENIKEPVEKNLDLISSLVIEGNFSVLLTLEGSEKKRRSQADLVGIRAIHYATIVKKVYQPNDDIERKLLEWSDKLTLDQNKGQVLIELYHQIKRAHRDQFSITLEIAKKINNILKENKNNNYLMDYHISTRLGEKSHLRKEWDKFPWDIRGLVMETPFCIVNEAYKSHYLIVSEQYDETTFIAATARNKNYDKTPQQWRYRGESLIPHGLILDLSLYPHDDFIPCQNNKRRVILVEREFGNTVWDVNKTLWDLKDFDWKNNLYLLYNRHFGEYLHADSTETLYPSVTRQVYTKKINNVTPGAAVWRLVNC